MLAERVAHKGLVAKDSCAVRNSSATTDVDGSVALLYVAPKIRQRPTYSASRAPHPCFKSPPTRCQSVHIAANHQGGHWAYPGPPRAARITRLAAVKVKARLL